MGVVRRLTAFRLHSPRTHRKEIRRFLELTKAATERGYRNRLHVLTRYDVREQLKDVCCPTLFLASDRDNLVPALEQARLMSARVPRAVMRVLEGHGHICLIAPGIELDAILREWDPSLATEEPQGPRRRSPAGDDV
jgi:pimeloyl-ACP methyl ester carboxylesterase